MLAEKRRIYFFVKLYIPGMELTKNFIQFSVFFLECYFIGHTFAGQK